MSTFETIVTAHIAKEKAVAAVNAMEVPLDEFHKGDCIVWVRSRDRMLNIRYRGVNAIVVDEQCAKDLRDILNGLFPAGSDSVKQQDCAPTKNDPANADEWPKVWLTPDRGAIRFMADKSASTLYVALSLNGHVTPSSIEFGNSPLALHGHVLLRPEAKQ